MDYSRYKNLTVEKKDRIAVVTMNRPDTLNAVNLELHKDLVHVFDDLVWDDDVWVVILTGAGGVFSAGGDMKSFKQMRVDPQQNPVISVEEGINILRNIVELPKPVIAAVNGTAIGLATSLAFACDIIIAAENARFADAHVSMGIASAHGGYMRLESEVGMAKAKEHLFTADPLDLRDAERMGIVNKVVPADQVMPEAMAFANRLAAGPPLAIKYTKMAINREVSRRLHAILPTSLALEFLCFTTKDHEEAINAFLEKRRPRFTGR